jgi:serine/threonine protein phosphatase PrpC
MTQPAPRQPGPEGRIPASPVPHVLVRSFGLTDPGKVRDSNEDHFLIAELARTLWVRQTSLTQPPTQYGRNRGHIFLVADGMGGHQAGEVASALTMASIETFILHVLHRFSNLDMADEQGVVKDLQEALQQADARLFREAAHHPEFTGMGTTLTMALATGWRLFVIHVGDSRCYLFREGRLDLLTIDHTMVAELARRGVIKPEEVRKHSLRHVVTNALGGKEKGVRVDVSTVDLNADDVVVLCSDGLTDMLTDNQIAAIVAAEGEPKTACERLVHEANGLGGRDNITAIVARFETPPLA